MEKQMKKHLVLVGGGHAHMMILENIRRFIEKGIRVTVIGPSDYHYYSGMGPGMLGGTYQPDDIRFATRKVVEHQGGVFVRDRAVRIDPDKRIVDTASSGSFEYDLLSANAGSAVPMGQVDGSHDTVYSVKPIEKLMAAAEKLKALFLDRAIHIGIAGGGPSSAEVAGNVWQLARQTGAHMPKITIFAGNKFMARFPESVRKRVIRDLHRKDIVIDETGYIESAGPDSLTLASGQRVSVDFIFMALGVQPSGIFKDSGLPVGPDGGLLVNSFLQSVQYPEIFGGGDCICFEDQPLDKVGVYAVRQNPVLLHNLFAMADQAPLMRFDPGPEYLLIFNTGAGTGVFKKRWLVFGGRLAFWIKDFIDRRFMNKFQAIEKKL